jgi:hypothetical protein
MLMFCCEELRRMNGEVQATTAVVVVILCICPTRKDRHPTGSHGYQFFRSGGIHSARKRMQGKKI